MVCRGARVLKGTPISDFFLEAPLSVKIYANFIKSYNLIQSLELFIGIRRRALLSELCKLIHLGEEQEEEFQQHS
jgi:hypothetical protein